MWEASGHISVCFFLVNRLIASEHFFVRPLYEEGIVGGTRAGIDYKKSRPSIDKMKEHSFDSI